VEPRAERNVATRAPNPKAARVRIAALIAINNRSPSHFARVGGPSEARSARSRAQEPSRN
jgi:hypothetical protein